MTDLLARSNTPPLRAPGAGTTSSTAADATRGTILYEAHNLTFKGGTSGSPPMPARWPRPPAARATGVDGLFGVERGLSRGRDALNEILAFDAIDDNEWLSPFQVAWRTLNYPFNAPGRYAAGRTAARVAW